MSKEAAVVDLSLIYKAYKDHLINEIDDVRALYGVICTQLWWW